MKIIKEPKFKPVTCGFCGCIYEYEKGDKIECRCFQTCDRIVTKNMFLSCPVCNADNKLYFYHEKSEAE